MPEMPEISPSVSNSSVIDCDESFTSSDEMSVTTPPQSPPVPLNGLPAETEGETKKAQYYTVDPKTKLPIYDFPSLKLLNGSDSSMTDTLSRINAATISNASSSSTSKSIKPSPVAVKNGWITKDSSGKTTYNFPSLNKRVKAPTSPGPNFNRDISTEPTPPSPKKSTNTYINATTPYTRPGATLAITGMRSSMTMTSANKQVSPERTPGSRPQISMPKSQPLSRALFSKISENAGAPVKRSCKPEKLIVPSKAFQTVFELPLTSSEFARRK
jgi:hypothetical protein